MEKLKLYLIKNWKTTVSAIVAGVVGILVNAGSLTPEQSTILLSIASFFGLAAAKDADKSGNTVEPNK